MPATEQQLAQQHRQQQARLRADVTRDVVALWNGMTDPGDIDKTWPGLRDILARLVGDRRKTSARAAADYYLAARTAAGVAGEFAPSLAPPVEGEALRTALDVTGPVAFKRAIKLGRSARQALDQAAVQLAGAASRIVLDGGRGTVHRTIAADPAATGYARITDTEPCAFCAMLAGRGAVYSSGRAAGDVRYGGDPFHDHCACIAAPVYGDGEAWQQHSKDLADEWNRVTRGLTGAEARRAWRRHWDAQQADRRRDSERRDSERREAEERAQQERRRAEEDAARREAERQEAERREAERRAADPLDGVDLRELSDEQIADLAARHADRPDIFERLAAELDRRDRADQDDRDSFGAFDDEPTDSERRIAELVDQGWDYRDAYAEVHGLDPAELDRQERRAAVDVERREGESLDQTVRRMYDEWLHIQYLAAEAATNGYMVTREGVAAGVDPLSLFSGPAARARKYASEELKRWWADGNRRMTFAEFRADVLGRESDKRAARRTREGSSGREFGL